MEYQHCKTVSPCRKGVFPPNRPKLKIWTLQKRGDSEVLHPTNKHEECKDSLKDVGIMKEEQTRCYRTSEEGKIDNFTEPRILLEGRHREDHLNFKVSL